METNTNKDRSKRLVYPKLSYKIVGLCFDVHNELGRFAREKQYADLLEDRLNNEGIKYYREYAISNSGNVVDFLIEDKIILELKTVRVLTRSYFRQLQNYLQQTKIELGMLVNFSDKHLKPRRILRLNR